MKIEWFVKTNLMVPVSAHSEDFENFVELPRIGCPVKFSKPFNQNKNHTIRKLML